MCSVAAESAATLQAMNPLVKVGPQPASMLAWMTGANAPTRSQLSWLQEHTLILLAGADLATQVPAQEMHFQLRAAGVQRRIALMAG